MKQERALWHSEPVLMGWAVRCRLAKANGGLSLEDHPWKMLSPLLRKTSMIKDSFIISTRSLFLYHWDRHFHRRNLKSVENDVGHCDYSYCCSSSSPSFSEVTQSNWLMLYLGLERIIHQWLEIFGVVTHLVVSYATGDLVRCTGLHFF